MSIENIFLSLSIETDGIIVTSNRDPPGQKSVYIAPGDTRRESYRLSTFKDFPGTATVDPRQLASKGFYYTGYRDRVKCFSCGRRVEQWEVEDDPASSRWHFHDYDFFNGRDDTNVPISAMFSRFQQPRSSRQTPQSSAATSRTNQNETGASGSGEPPLSSSRSPRRETSPPPTYQRSRRRPSKPSTPPTNGYEQSLMNSVTAENAELFPCLYPVNPHMRSAEARLQTFIDNSSIWPAHRIRASPREIVDAGFYYLGERDRAKCWYCNGGLQNWEYDDDPWIEHGKWFPLCEYVLRIKGVQFVHNIITRFPHLRRPTISNPSNSVHFTFPRIQTSARSTRTLPRGQSASNPVIVDPQRDQELRNRRIEEEMSSSTFVVQAKIMGFDERHIKEAMKRQYERFDVGFSSFESLVDALVDCNPSNASPRGNDSPPVSAAKTGSNQSEPTRASGEQELRELQDQRSCKICHCEQANIVFIPCGHLAVCMNCSENITQCPTCKSYIREKVRSYLS